MNLLNLQNHAIEKGDGNYYERHHIKPRHMSGTNSKKKKGIFQLYCRRDLH